MRGLGRTFSHLPHARALIAGAAFLAGIVSAQAQGTQPDETAMAIPRVEPPDGGSVGLPQPLPPSEARRVRRIFALQALGDMQQAEAETARLQDPSLLGDILADRYLAPDYQASVAELTAWLDRYPDLPDAPAIRAQALLRAGPGVAVPGVQQAPGAANPGPPSPEDADASDLPLSRDPGLDHAVRDRVHAGRYTDALRVIERQRKLAPDYAGQLHAEVARAAFADGLDERALAIANIALRQSGGRIALAGFVGGLAAWRLDRVQTAAILFERASQAALAPPALRAAGAFWAARAQQRLGHAAAARDWLRRAGTEPRTFYGILARRLLGIGPDLPRDDQDTGALGEADVAAVDGTLAGHRAFALLQVGQTARAASALRQLWATANPGLSRAVLLVAQAAGLDDVAAELATRMQAADGRRPEGLSFPMPRLRPRGGFRVDPAIVYALARLESNFDAQAVSPAGARGLMQLMPNAVGAVADTSVSPRALADPGLNLELGQRYLLLLAGLDAVDGNLIRLLASYNAGPAAAARWMEGAHDHGDPLIFIESIPIDETRAYVRRALTYIWIYAAQLHRPAPGLDALAKGAWPRLASGQEHPYATEASLTDAARHSQLH